MKNRLLSVGMATGLLLSVSSYAQTTLYGITDANAIFTMSNVNSPSSINGPYSITGVASGQVLVGLDARPSNGGLYALGYDSTSMMAELYKLSASGTTYTATAVSGTLASMNLGSTNNVSFDFVSTADNQIRVIGRNGNNYMMSAVSGAVTSTGTVGMSYGSGDLYSASSNIMAATAYTNSFYGADATQEVGYDAVNNVLVRFDAGNFANGFNNSSNTIHSIGTTTGVVFSSASSIGMDSWYDTVAHNNSLFITGNTLISGAHLYRYDMSSSLGTLVDLGAIGSGSLNIRDIAFGTYRDSTSSIAGHLMTGLSLNLRNLIYFDSEHPGNIRRVVSLTGMTSGQTMVAIDYAASGTLYGLGYNSGSHTYQLYTIDSATGSVTAINSSALALNLGSDDGSGNRINVGFRFIPTLTNRIRVIGNNGSVNVQLDATTGAVVATDTAAQYITGDASFGATANISSVAYTGYQGDDSTQMFGFDANTGMMIMFSAGDDAGGYGIGASGYISTGVSLGTVLDLLLHNSSYNNAHMNIMYNQTTSANIGFMAANYEGDSSDMLNYSIMYDMSDMLSGYHKGTAVTPTQTGTIGYGVPVKDVSSTRAYTPVTTTGVNSVAVSNDLLVYPNPATSDTHIVLPQLPASTVFVDVIDMNGHILGSYQYAPGNYQLDLDMSSLPIGIYSVRVFGNDISYHNMKVVKQ